MPDRDKLRRLRARFDVTKSEFVWLGNPEAQNGVLDEIDRLLAEPEPEPSKVAAEWLDVTRFLTRLDRALALLRRCSSSIEPGQLLQDMAALLRECEGGAS